MRKTVSELLDSDEREVRRSYSLGMPILNRHQAVVSQFRYELVTREGEMRERRTGREQDAFTDSRMIIDSIVVENLASLREPSTIQIN